MHLEFIIPGAPFSNHATATNLAKWRSDIVAEARRHWGRPPLVEVLKAIIINFHLRADPNLDVDNLSKPILDALQGIVYEDDRQIRQAEIAHAPVYATFQVAGSPIIIVTALQEANPFVYVRITEPLDPLPLPK
jgi:hypothetical protein